MSAECRSSSDIDDRREVVEIIADDELSRITIAIKQTRSESATNVTSVLPPVCFCKSPPVCCLKFDDINGWLLWAMYCKPGAWVCISPIACGGDTRISCGCCWIDPDIVGAGHRGFGWPAACTVGNGNDCDDLGAWKLNASVDAGNVGDYKSQFVCLFILPIICGC